VPDPTAPHLRAPAPERQPAARTLVQWLRGRSDDQLLALLRRRPDLGLPAPSDIVTLASRVAVRTSVQRAIDSIDAWRLRVLEALVLTAGTGEQPSVADAADLLGAAPDVLTAAIDDLAELALVWGEGADLRLAPSVIEALGPYPAGLGRPVVSLLRTASDLVLASVLRSLDLPPSSQPRSGTALARALGDRAQLTALLTACGAD
jgi:hypothetical protein